MIVGLTLLATVVTFANAIALHGPMVGFPSPYSPVMGFSPRMGGYGANYFNQGGFQNQQQQRPELLTCIGRDMNDMSSQMRLTITGSGGRSRRGGMFQGGFGGNQFDDDFDGFDDFDDMFDFDDFEGGFGGDMDDDDDRRTSFRMDGTFIPSVNVNKADTYYVVITQYGRTGDGCSAQALGPIYQGRQSRGMSMGRGFGFGYGNLGGFGGFGGMGSFGKFGPGFGHGMGYKFGHSGFLGPMNPVGQFWNQGNQMQQNQILPGQLANRAIIAGSATIYSTTISGFSKSDIAGRGIALCKSIEGGQCRGYIPFCCTITKDSLPALEVFVTDDDDELDDDNFQMGPGSFPINAGAQLGGGVQVNDVGRPGLGGSGGLFEL